MEIAKAIIIPIIADRVLSPDMLYYANDVTGIYFHTEDDEFGRITFDKLDAIKVCRGEYLPFPDDWKIGQPFSWVYKVENSKWLKERFDYENKNYGTCYEFGGDVNEMLTDYSHYVFEFHDEFVEAIAAGFWFEKDPKSLPKAELLKGHPLLPLPVTEVRLFEASGIKYKAVFNTIAIEKLVHDTKYCKQKLIEVEVELDGKFSAMGTLMIMQRNGKVISVLSQYFRGLNFVKDGVAGFDDIKPLIEKEISEIAERRRQKGK